MRWVHCRRVRLHWRGCPFPAQFIINSGTTWGKWKRVNFINITRPFSIKIQIIITPRLKWEGWGRWARGPLMARKAMNGSVLTLTQLILETRSESEWSAEQSQFRAASLARRAVGHRRDWLINMDDQSNPSIKRPTMLPPGPFSNESGVVPGR